MGIAEMDPISQLSLPPGFRFFPTDEELLVQYLCRKVAGHQFSLQIIAEIDLYKFDPWVLPSKAIFGEKEWYFFSPRDRKYPNGSRPNRVAGTGYWKATGTDKVILTEGRKVGIKKALVFYVGKAPKGTKTNWIMHEYRLIDSSRKIGSTKLDEWVLCRIYKKNSGSNNNNGQKMSLIGNNIEQQYSNNGSSSSSSSHLEDVLDSLPSIDDRYFSLPRVNSLKTLNFGDDKLSGLLNLAGSGSFDWATLAALNSVNELAPSQQTLPQCTGTIGFGGGADVYVPSAPGTCHVEYPGKRVGSAEEEVQSGLRTQQHNSGFRQHNSGGLTHGYGGNPVDPYGFRYSGQSNGFGFGRN